MVLSLLHFSRVQLWAILSDAARDQSGDEDEAPRNLKTRLLVGCPYYLLTFGVSGTLVFFLVVDTVFIAVYEASSSNDEAWKTLF